MKPNFSEASLSLADDLCKELKISEKEFIKIDQVIDEWSNETNYTNLEMTYYGEPKSQARPRSTSMNGGFFYDPSKSLKQWVLSQVISQLPPNFKPSDDGVEMSMRFYRAMPKSGSKVNKVLMELGVIRPSGRPDIDNFIKLVQDALNKTLYTDDSNIVTLKAEKFYSVKPRVELSIKFRKVK
jgi:Holliday junction resolvase RusA-like endonuclease